MIYALELNKNLKGVKYQLKVKVIGQKIFKKIERENAKLRRKDGEPNCYPIIEKLRKNKK